MAERRKPAADATREIETAWRQIRGVLKDLADQTFLPGLSAVQKRKILNGTTAHKVEERMLKARDWIEQIRRRADGRILDGELRELVELVWLVPTPHPNDGVHQVATAPARLRQHWAHEIRPNDDGTLDEVVAYGAVHLEQMDTGSWALVIDGFDGQRLRVPIYGRGKVAAFAERDGAPDPQSQALNRLEQYVRDVDDARLAQIAAILEAVDGRCAAADGPVTKTRHEMTDDELREIYRLATGKRS